MTSVVFPFVVPPNLWEYQSGHVKGVAGPVGVFAAAAITGVMVLPLAKFDSKRYRRRWWVAAILALAAALSCLFLYFHQINILTVPYAGTYTAIGTIEEMLPEARRDYEESLRDEVAYSVERFVFDSGGITYDIWPSGILEFNRNLLSALYLACISLFTVFVLTCAQTFLLEAQTS